MITRSATNRLLRQYGILLLQNSVEKKQHEHPDNPPTGPLEHAAWMCEQSVAHSDADKKQRWLGFIQGILWVCGVRTLEELKSDVVGAYRESENAS